MRRILTAAMFPLAMAACSTNPEAIATAVVPPVNGVGEQVPAIAVSHIMIPEGTMLHARLEHPVGAMAPQDETVTATLIEPILTADGEIVLPTGTMLNGRVTGAVAPHAGAPGAVRLNFESLTFEGLTYPMTTRITGVDVAIADDATPTPMGAAARGSILDGPGAQAAFARVGAGVGTAISLGTSHGAMLPMGTRLMVQPLQDIPLHSDNS